MQGSAQKAPDAFRTISEVATELDVPQHVLRFWESKFSAIKPLKRGGGRRYYRPDDVDLLRGIRSLLYSDGLTIKGVQKILREQGTRAVIEMGRGERALLPQVRKPAAAVPQSEPASNVRNFPRETAARAPGAERARFERLLDELTELKGRLRGARN
jgi:DNA-binding transcriptional MerR regulator